MDPLAKPGGSRARIAGSLARPTYTVRAERAWERTVTAGVDVPPVAGPTTCALAATHRRVVALAVLVAWPLLVLPLVTGARPCAP